MKKEIHQSYEKLAGHYEFEVDTKPYNAYLERPSMVKNLPELSGKRVLDAGCAAGWYASYMAKKGASVTAVDLSESMIEATQRRTMDHSVHAYVHDLSFPFSEPCESFDLIVSSLTLHYIRNWEPVFKEFNRLLKPGGMLLFSTHHPLMDFVHFPVENYYEVQLLHDQWKINGERVQMNFYRRPLGEIIRHVTEHFQLKNLTEPTPTEDFKRVHPVGYKKVSANPNFLIIKAEKPEAIC